ncbi:MAG: copper chaperone PCu(A)C [Pseudonocardiaceae bacterium]
MSRRHSSMRRPLAVTALVAACCAAAVALAGCGAGQITQTDSQVAAVPGAYGDVGSIALRNVLIHYPPSPNGTYPVGSNVPVLLTIANLGTSADELISVTSPAASQVLVLGTSTIPPGTNVTSTIGPTPAGAQSPLVAGELRIVLNTTQPLRAGLNTPVTFVFRDAGTVTVPVPMAAPPSAPGEVPERVAESDEESGGHSGGHG